MGIPSLYRTLIGKYENIHTSNNEEPPDHLYMDYNCLIHHCKNKLKPINSSQRDIEEELITDIIRYTVCVINFVKPKKLVFISIDGPVPMSKVVKQRYRRYKKVQDTSYMKKLHEKYNSCYEEHFNGNKITPGTQFMYKLGSRLRSFAKLGAFNKHRNSNFKVFISDANVPGEGEQKIMDFIKNGELKQSGIYPKLVIYGLDADLIILAMLLKRSNIKLLREVQNTNTEMNLYHDKEFVFFDVDKCFDSLISEYKLSHFERNSLIDDFAFMTMFGGNDFVEPFLHTKMKDNGLEKIMVSYTQILKEGGNHVIINNTDINYDFLMKWLSKITEIEDYCVRKNNLNKHSKNAIDKEKDIEFEKELYEHSLYKDRINPFHTYYNEEFKKIDYKQENAVWKEQFNNYFFSGINLDEVCMDYIISLKWNWLYYNYGHYGWYWYYKHRHSPLCSDFTNYMKEYDKNTFKLLWDSIQFPQSSPMSPFEQLLIVTPIQHNFILPFCVSQFLKEHGSEFPLLFPKKFALDAVKGGKNIYSDPLLPDIELDLLRIILKECVYTEPEIARNHITEKLFCHVIK